MSDAGRGGQAKVQWPVVAVYGLVVIGIVTLFAFQAAAPLDATELRNQAESVRSDVSEALLTLSHRERATATFWATHLDDMANNIGESTPTLQRKGFDEQLRAARQSFFDLSDQVVKAVHDASLLYDQPAAVQSQRHSLEEAGRALDRLIGSLPK
ncbi:MAG: hypothetical protein ACR2KI_00010 [Candidatus Limnocylindria bacterium]